MWYTEFVSTSYRVTKYCLTTFEFSEAVDAGLLHGFAKRWLLQQRSLMSVIRPMANGHVGLILLSHLKKAEADSVGFRRCVAQQKAELKSIFGDTLIAHDASSTDNVFVKTEQRGLLAWKSAA